MHDLIVLAIGLFLGLLIPTNEPPVHVCLGSALPADRHETTDPSK